MHKNILALLAILTLFLVSCAGSNLLEKKQEKEDLVKVFDLEDEEKFKKFITKEKPAVKKADAKELKKVTKKKKKVKSKKLVKPKKAKSPKKVVSKTQETPVEKEPKAVVNPETLEDYPKAYRKYNQKFAKYWKMYRPTYNKGEKFSIEISWSMFTAGVAKIETLGDLEIGENEVIGFKANLDSAEYFEGIYKLKNSLTSYVSKENFFPVKYVLKQRESGQNVDDLQLFDEENLKTYFWYKRVKKNKNKDEKKESYIPRYFTDSFSALYFMRGMPFKIGTKFEFPVVTRTKVWLLNAEVVKKENIKIMGKKVPAYKIRAVTRFPGVLKKRGDINFWYSADKSRKILKFEAKIKIGTVKGELIDYQAGE